MKYYNIIKAHPILDMDDDVMSPVNIEIHPMDDDDEIEEDAPEDSASTLLQLALTGEYQQWDLYTAYASRLKGLTRGAIADEFKAHAGEELGHIELLQRYLVSMGENPTLQRKAIPEMPDTATIKDIVKMQLSYEKEAVLLYEKILNILPENEPLKLDIESVIIKEQEHVHDLELLLKNASIAKVMAGYLFRPTEHGEPTKPSAGYGQGCGCNCPSCTCDLPFLAKVDQKWCTKALKELRPDIYARWYQGKLLTSEEKAFVAHAIAMKLGLKDKRAVLRFLDSKKA
jgi:bacterioferritin (cytochrome b1)